MPDPPFKVKSASVRGRRDERVGAKIDGGYVVPMSGGGRRKGDYQGPTFKVENKTTDAESFTLKLDTLLKAEREAHLTPPVSAPMLRISLGKGTRRRTYRLVDERDWKALGHN
jgi:hypothetical protein